MTQQIISVLKLFIKTIFSLKTEALKYMFYTGIIAFILLALLIIGIWKFSGAMGDYMAQMVPWDWAQNSVMFSIIVALSVLVVSWIAFKYILLAILSPLLSWVSEKIEKRIQGHNAGKGFSLTASTARGLRINTRNIIKEIVLSIVILLMGLVPGIHVVALILLFLIQSYFAGFGIMDFYLERHFTFRETLAEVYKHKWAAMTLGGIFTMLLFIPIIGVLIAPYLSTATATQYFINENNKPINKSFLV